ncbi:CPBP family intramembrane glutamic endopeptidase [Winogradskyella forsetii]|uniref:CPBP family intramembrane glutamic endopeptidase n=1 Tax=Winogradskyella forsetii TaxID=2686077 RepID=UPI0015BCEA24|nr:CPBP family intramembrane glutamic endopeptidase [Winogradskyella forsetii]
MIFSCKKCHATFESEVKFCSNCGVEIQKSSIENRAETLNFIIIFYVVFLVYAASFYLISSELEQSLALDITFESIFAVLVLGFSVFDYKSIFKLYKLPKIDWKIIVFTVIFPLFSAFSVYFSIDYLNAYIFETIDDNYYEAYLYLDQPLLWSILFIAILPPIFEELAFRGFLFNQLQKVVSEKVTIIGTAFIFALVHFSFISLLWILPFGLILGYIRSKYNTLWYGIIIHFIHNFIVLMIDYYSYNAVLLEF